MNVLSLGGNLSLERQEIMFWLEFDGTLVSEHTSLVIHSNRQCLFLWVTFTCGLLVVIFKILVVFFFTLRNGSVTQSDRLF